MEHEALLRLEASERASCAERAAKEAQEAKESVELEAESLRAQVPYTHDPRVNPPAEIVRVLWGANNFLARPCRRSSSLILIASHSL